MGLRQLLGLAAPEFGDSKDTKSQKKDAARSLISGGDVQIIQGAGLEQMAALIKVKRRKAEFHLKKADTWKQRLRDGSIGRMKREEVENKIGRHQMLAESLQADIDFIRSKLKMMGA